MTTADLAALAGATTTGKLSKEVQALLETRLRQEISAVKEENERRDAIRAENLALGERHIKRIQQRATSCRHRKGPPANASALQGQGVVMSDGGTKEVYICSRCATTFIWPPDQAEEKSLEYPCPPELRPEASAIGRPHYH